MDRLYARVKGILQERRRDLSLLVAELIKRETLDRTQADDLLAAANKQPEPEPALNRT